MKGNERKCICIVNNIHHCGFGSSVILHKGEGEPCKIGLYHLYTWSDVHTSVISTGKHIVKGHITFQNYTFIGTYINTVYFSNFYCYAYYEYRKSDIK